MSKLLQIDSPMWTAFTKLSDLVILNICFLIGCIPLFTIGASWTALYYTAMKMVRDEESSIIESFWHSYKQNIKQATLMWVVVLLFFALIIVDLILAGSLPNGIKSILHVGIEIAGIAGFLTALYSFPLLSRFENMVYNIYIISFIMSIRHMGSTMIITFITIAPILILIINTSFIPTFILLYLIIGFGLSAYINSFLFVRIFNRYGG